MRDIPFPGGLPGRLSRGAYRPMVFFSVVAVAALFFTWRHYGEAEVSLVACGPLVLLPLKFVGMGRRLHDVGWSAWFAAPVLLLLALHIFATYWIRHIGAPWYLWPWNPSGILELRKIEVAAIGLCGIVLALDVWLFFARGTEGENVYGRSPIGQHPAAEYF